MARAQASMAARLHARLMVTVVAVVLLAMVMTLLLTRIQAVMDKARVAELQASGVHFRSALLFVREWWFVQGQPTAPKVLTEFAGQTLALSEQGWPVDAGEQDQFQWNPVMDSAERCARLWTALMIDGQDCQSRSAQLSQQGRESLWGCASDIRYQARVQQGRCQFDHPSGVGLIEYDATNGRVNWIIR
ncbi:MAG: hypothetical protein IBX52_03415 [Bacterioplanes sp.]|nr:hypothetical protein [Bacterioplanes sp.]